MARARGTQASGFVVLVVVRKLGFAGGLLGGSRRPRTPLVVGLDSTNSSSPDLLALLVIALVRAAPGQALL